MHSQLVKWFSIAALLVSVLSSESAANYQLDLKLVIYATAALAVALVTLRSHRLTPIMSIADKTPARWRNPETSGLPAWL